MLPWCIRKLFFPTPVMLALGLAGTPQCLPAAVVTGIHQQPASANTLNWQVPARWHHGLKKTSGTLHFSSSGVEFQAAKGSRLQWSFDEIQTFKISPHAFKLTGYANRRWHFHGERSFHFHLKFNMPPSVAAMLAGRVGKPAQNGDPNPQTAAFATLGARRRTRTGGTNGVLRFRDGGIDYVTPNGRGARSWRWQDIRTIANPDPYHFRVDAYREVFSFELKQPMSQQLFDRLWNDVYARDLSGLRLKEGGR